MYLLSALLFYIVRYINIFLNNILVDIINCRNYKYINNSLFILL